MNTDALKQILDAVASGKTSVEEAATSLATHTACENIGYANVDHHRSRRQGFPEVIFGLGKTADQIYGIMERLTIREDIVLVTRIAPEAADQVTQKFPEATFHEDAGMIVYRTAEPVITGRGVIAVFCAGTSDIPVAREAYLTAEAMGNEVELVCDVGVAGIHRLFNYLELIQSATVLVVVAGMEGALPSVVAGLTSRPVIAVPTSIGYGASLGGLTALLGMLNSCSSNVAVVNIDNGFGAGFMAACINREEK
jgi:pyridinium-3,5-biscarboxylic acid mononucleotide synthase